MGARDKKLNEKSSQKCGKEKEKKATEFSE
jgi:hypothetical protein